MASFDEPPAIAADLALQDINAAGGIGGRKVEMVTSDNKTKVEEGRRAALEVIEKGASFIQTTCDFDLGAPIAAEAGEKGIVAMSDCAGSVQFGPQGIGPLAYTMASPSLSEGMAMAEWAAERKGLKHPFLLKDTSLEYYIQAIAGFEQGIDSVGGSIAGEDTYKSTDPSIAPTVKRIQDSGADSIYLTGIPTSGASAIKQIRAAGIDLPILGPNTYDGDDWKEAVPDVSNMYFTAYGSIFGDDPNPFVNQLVKRYTKVAGDPPASSAMLTGYGVIEAFKVAAEKCDCLDGEGISDALQTFKNEKLLHGAMLTTFSKDLHITLDRPLAIMQVQDGKTSYLETWKLKTLPSLDF